MTDLLIPLYNLPARRTQSDLNKGVIIRRALTPEKHLICKWIEKEFSQGWRSEAEVAMSAQPVRLWVALEDQDILGFACFDATAKGFFGPTGIRKDVRGKGLGGQLLLETLWGMYDAGYGYGIIGGVSSPDFYVRYINAIEIPDSTPGIYQGLLK